MPPPIEKLGGEERSDGTFARLRQVPMRRLGSPWEAARVAAFLASDDAFYVTAVAMPVDGGLILHNQVSFPKPLDADHLLDVRYLFAEDALDAVFPCHGGHRTTAASTGQLHADNPISDINQFYVAAICLKGRPYLLQCCLHIFFHPVPPWILLGNRGVPPIRLVVV